MGENPSRFDAAKAIAFLTFACTASSIAYNVGLFREIGFEFLTVLTLQDMFLLASYLMILVLFAASISAFIISLAGGDIINVRMKYHVKEMIDNFKKELNKAYNLIDMERTRISYDNEDATLKDRIDRLESDLDNNREKLNEIESEFSDSYGGKFDLGISKKDAILNSVFLIFAFWQAYNLFFSGIEIVIYIAIALFFLFISIYLVFYLIFPSIRVAVLPIWILVTASSILAVPFGLGRIDGIYFNSKDIDTFEISVTYQEEKVVCTSALLVTRGIICNSDGNVVFVERSMISTTRVL